VTMTVPPTRSTGRALQAAALCAAVVCLPLAAARAQSKAMTLAEVLDLRRQGVSTRQIIRNARTYCIAFAMNDSVKHELTSAGADTGLVGGLSDVCSTERIVVRGPPPLIDDELAHTNASQGFAWNDRRCQARFETFGVRVENRRSDAVCLMRYPSAELGSSVRIELTLAQLGANLDGLVMLGFGRSGNSANHYALSVGADRRVELCWNADGQCNPLVRRTGVEAIQLGATDENHLAVEVRGQEIAFFVNDVRIGTYTADATVTGRITLGIGPGTSLLLVKLRAVALP